MNRLAVMTTAVSTTYRQPVIYPESDGQPMGESDLHVDETLDLKAVLMEHYRDDARVYVASNNFFYYEEGNPRAVFSPDIYVVRGIEKRQRRIYKLWEEEAVPCFILEVSSRQTWKKDYQDKLSLYARLGVQDYFLYDPADETDQPTLVGYRLSDEVPRSYRRISPEADGSFISQALQLKLWLDQHERIRCTDPSSGQVLLRPHQAYAAIVRTTGKLKQAQARAQAEAARADTEAARAQAEAARAQAEATRAEAEAARAEAEAARAEAEAAKAEAAALRAKAAEEELEQLRRALKR